MRLTRAALLPVAIVVASVLGMRAGAQQPGARQTPSIGSLAGSVTNATNGSAVRADITIDRPHRTARTDSTGRFIFRDIPVGRVRLRAASFGYEPVDTTLTVRVGDTVIV